MPPKAGGGKAMPKPAAASRSLPSVLVRIPDHWTTTEGVHLSAIAFERRAEFQEVLNKTWRLAKTRDRKKVSGSAELPTGGRVVNVLRIENHPNFSRYCAYMADVRQRRGRCEEFAVATRGSFSKHLETDVNAMYLFHGTSPQAADLIARSDFRIDLAGSAVGTMFGPGLYLAEHASKGDEYAKEGDGIFMGQYALIVCRAIAGRVYTTEKKGNFADKVGSGEYDSVCGDRLAAVGTFREMVFYDSAAVCPEYIVIYNRTYEEAPHVDDVITVTQKTQHDFCGGFNVSVEVSVDPFGSFALVSNYSGNDVVKVDLQSGKQTAVFSGFNHPVQIAIARSGSFALVGNAGGSVTKISLPEGCVLHTFTQFRSAKGVAISPDDSFALIGDCGNSIGRIDLKSNEVSFPYKVKFMGNSVSIASDGSFALFADYGSGEVGRIDLAIGAVTFRYKCPFAHGVAIAPDDAYALIGMKGDSVGYVDLQTGEVDLKRYIGFKGALGVCIVPDGTYALVANCSGNSLSKIVLRDGPLLKDMGHGDTGMAAPAAAAPATTTAESADQLCKMGCGRKVAPPWGGRVFNTCCRNCAQGEGHNGTCCPG